MTSKQSGIVDVALEFQISGERKRPHAQAPGNDHDDNSDHGTTVLNKTQSVVKKPNMYRVLLLNDDYTTQEFVTLVLQKYFSKSFEEAFTIMMHVHKHGVGVCGIYTFEIAETKVVQVMDFARANQYPLQCVMEKN